MEFFFNKIVEDKEYVTQAELTWDRIYRSISLIHNRNSLVRKKYFSCSKICNIIVLTIADKIIMRNSVALLYFSIRSLK